MPRKNNNKRAWRPIRLEAESSERSYDEMARDLVKAGLASPAILNPNRRPERPNRKARA